MMEGGGSDGGTDGGEESGGAGHPFRPWVAVFIGKQSFAYMGGRSQWQVMVFVHGQGVVSWVLIIRAWGLSSSALSFMVVVAVLGAGLSFMGAVSLFVGGGAHPQVVICGWWGSSAGGVCCSWLMFTGCGCCTCMGWGRSWIIVKWGGRCFVVVLLWCVMLLPCHTIHMVAMSPCW